MEGYIGNVITDATKDPNIKTSINAEVSAQTTNIENVASLFSTENGMGGKLVSFTQWDNLTDDQKKEKISVTVLDDNLKEKTIEVDKYVKVAAANQNNAIVPEMTENQIKAAQGYLRKSVVDGLQKTIKQGKEPQKFNPNNQFSVNRKKEKNQIILIDEVVRDGTEESLQALVRSNSNVSAYEVTDKGIVFTLSDGNKTSPIDISSGLAKDVGTQLAAELGIDPNSYKSETKAGGGNVNSGIGDFTTFTGTQKVYGGIDEFVFGKKMVLW